MSNTFHSSPHYRNCNLCEAICGIEITVQHDRQLEIRGDKDDPFSRGYICPKAVALQDFHYDKDIVSVPAETFANCGQTDPVSAGSVR
jgi:anaerobic selenocysteine-containing dehydrogenase